jgi:hypothetical protein
MDAAKRDVSKGCISLHSLFKDTNTHLMLISCTTPPDPQTSIPGIPTPMRPGAHDQSPLLAEGGLVQCISLVLLRAATRHGLPWSPQTTKSVC